MDDFLGHCVRQEVLGQSVMCDIMTIFACSNALCHEVVSDRNPEF